MRKLIKELYENVRYDFAISEVSYASLKKVFERPFKFFYQRKTRGWDDSETWNLDYKLSHHILPRLRRFKEVTVCHPREFTPEEWDDVLDDMIFAFEWYGRDDSLEGIGENNYDSWKRAAKGAELFGKWYKHLWW